MLQLIEHRRNRSRELAALDKRYGAEIDVRAERSPQKKLYLAHDPWTPGEDLDSWLRQFAELGICGPLIVNTKEDGLENEIAARLHHYGIKNFFFLDTAPATLIKRCRAGLGQQMAVRYSSYEPTEAITAYLDKCLSERPAWIWVDCFDGLPVDATKLKHFIKWFKICLVSPELHGHAPSNIPKFKALRRLASAVCTKQPGLWCTESHSTDKTAQAFSERTELKELGP